MTRFTTDQLSSAQALRGYLGREAAIAFLKTMDIKVSVGHWSAGDFCDRFAPPGASRESPDCPLGYPLARYVATSGGATS